MINGRVGDASRRRWQARERGAAAGRGAAAVPSTAQVASGDGDRAGIDAYVPRCTQFSGDCRDNNTCRWRRLRSGITWTVSRYFQGLTYKVLLIQRRVDAINSSQ